MANEAQCPFSGATKQRQNMAGGGQSNRQWWPKQLNLGILHQHSSLSNPMGDGLRLRRRSSRSSTSTP